MRDEDAVRRGGCRTVGAWSNEPLPITDPNHPTGIGSSPDGRLVVGWRGEGDEEYLDPDTLTDVRAVATCVGSLSLAGGAGLTAEKLDFLSSVLLRRVDEPGTS